MSWTAIVVNMRGDYDHSFNFIGSHNNQDAFRQAQDRLRGSWLDVIVIVKGDPPVYHPSMDE